MSPHRLLPAVTRIVTHLLVVLAVSLGVAAHSWYVLIPEEPFMPALWPVLFGVAAVLVVAFMVKPGSHLLYRLAGSMAVVAWAARPVAVGVRWANGYVATARFVSGIDVYMTMAVFVGVFWIYSVGPYHERRR